MADYPTPLDLAETAYQGYADATGGKTWDGRDMPAWADLPERTVEAWVLAAVAVQTVTGRASPGVAGGVRVHTEGPDCWCQPEKTDVGVAHTCDAGVTHHLGLGPS